MNDFGIVFEAVLARGLDVGDHSFQSFGRQFDASDTPARLCISLRLFQDTLYSAWVALDVFADLARRPSNLGGCKDVYLASVFVRYFASFSLSKQAADACVEGSWARVSRG